jgi:sulfur-carrier protein
VVARHFDDGAARALRWNAEAVSLALDDQDGDGDRVELRQAALGLATCATGRQQRERQAEHGGSAGRLGGPAGNPRAERATPDHQRQAIQLVRPQVVDHCGPGGVELAGRGGRAPAGDPVRLLDEHDTEALLASGVSSGHQVRGAHPATGAVAEHECTGRVVGKLELRSRRTVGGFDVLCCHSSNDYAMAVVKLRGPLKKLAGDRAEHSIEARTVRGVLRELERSQPAVEGWILDERGTVRRHINVFVNGERAREDAPVGPADRIEILPAISGGGA